MFTVLVVLAVLGVLVGLVVLVASRAATGDRSSGQAASQHAVPHEQRGDAGDFPRPGEPSPHRADGRPVPGSRDDRHRRGQP